MTEKQFKESIMKEYEDVKIQKIDLFDSEQCNKCFYFENRLLAQLLIIISQVSFSIMTHHGDIKIN